MSDEIEERVPDLEEATDEAGEISLVEAGAGVPARPGPGSRLAGVLALVLGVVGTLLSLVLALLFLRALFGADDASDRAFEPVMSSFDRLEDRIDQTDDLIDRNGIDDARVAELRARVDGLVDVSSGADQAIQAVDDHPLYRLLPVELSDPASALAEFRTSAETIDEALGSGPTVRPAVAASLADEIDTMQARVTDTRASMADASSSLRQWIRLGSFLGFLGSIWVLWAQIVLARRGWRGLRGRSL